MHVNVYGNDQYTYENTKDYIIFLLQYVLGKPFSQITHLKLMVSLPDIIISLYREGRWGSKKWNSQEKVQYSQSKTTFLPPCQLNDQNTPQRKIESFYHGIRQDSFWIPIQPLSSVWNKNIVTVPSCRSLDN